MAEASAAPAEVAISVLEAAWSYEAGPPLRQVKAPIRAINADKFPTDLDAARRYAPQFEAVIMKGVGHYLMLEDPQRFNGLIEEAVKAVARGSEHPPSRPGGKRAR